MKAFTYLVYILFWESLCFGGCAYLVFWKDASGWWFVLAYILGCSAYSPRKWIYGGEQ